MNKDLKTSKNRPTAGPIRNNEDVGIIRRNLSDRPRDLLLFDLAVETGIGMKRLLPLKVKDLQGMKKGERFFIRNNRDKKNTFIVTETIYKTFHRYLKKIQPSPNDNIFKSQKGQRPLNLSSVSNMVNTWYAAAGIKGCYGAISLRKTWEYNQKDDLSPAMGASMPKAKSVFKPVETSSVQKTIYNELFNAIVTSKIIPGTRLTTAEISRSFKVSQAPVRVALNWLEARGFIISQKKRGSIVKELTIAELHEIIKIRIILETAAAKLSYRVRSEETLRLLEILIERYKGSSDFEETDRLNRLFHQTLYRDAEMPLLITIITDLYDRFSPYAAFTFANIGRMPDYDPEKDIPEYYHIKILEGMRRKNLSMILENIKKDLGRAMRFTEEVLKERPRVS